AFSLICTVVVVLYVIFLFFFQAEDGIRDGHVTGVQTCALPIYPKNIRQRFRGRIFLGWLSGQRSQRLRLRDGGVFYGRCAALDRSEERRVGKECRCRWWL